MFNFHEIQNKAFYKRIPLENCRQQAIQKDASTLVQSNRGKGTFKGKPSRIYLSI